MEIVLRKNYFPKSTVPDLEKFFVRPSRSRALIREIALSPLDLTFQIREVRTALDIVIVNRYKSLKDAGDQKTLFIAVQGGFERIKEVCPGDDIFKESLKSQLALPLDDGSLDKVRIELYGLTEKMDDLHLCRFQYSAILECKLFTLSADKM